ncbi:hypothetical protein LPJ56_004944, partial [Coemansia sp. RSA 2599]
MSLDSSAVPLAAPAAQPSSSSLLPPMASLPVRSMRRIVRIQLPPASGHAQQDAGSRWAQSAPDAVSRHADVASTAHNAACAADPLSFVTTISAAGADIRLGSDKASSSLIALPSDVIDAIADAVIGATHLSDSRRLAMQRLGVPLALSDESQSALRTLTHVCRAWRITLLPRAWRS